MEASGEYLIVHTIGKSQSFPRVPFGLLGLLTILTYVYVYLHICVSSQSIIIEAEIIVLLVIQRLRLSLSCGQCTGDIFRRWRVHHGRLP